MKQIRIGKDITVRWPILSNGAAVKLEGRDLTLFVRPPADAERRIGFSTEDNIIIFTIPGTDQMALGTYSITLWENYGKKGQTAVDVCEAFRLVSTTCKECGKDDGLKTETVDLDFSDMEVSVQDALYFASQLLPELAAPYLARIDRDEPETLQILGAAINDGAATTNERDITVRLDVAGTPTHYRIAGTSDFEGAEWLTYVSTPSYQLSEGNGEKSIYIQLRNATSESNVYVASVTLEEPLASGFRALLSLGWDWSAGGSAGSTIYDQTLQAGRVRIGNDNARYNIYDTSGTIVGTATIAGLKVPGSGNYGKVPGDNSGAYPDSLLKFCAYKPAANAEAAITMSLPVGEYRIRIFINTGVSTIDISQADYTLEYAGTVQRYPVQGTYHQNFNTVHELTVHVATDDPVIIRLKTADPRNEVLYLNVLDIEQI